MKTQDPMPCNAACMVLSLAVLACTVDRASAAPPDGSAPRMGSAYPVGVVGIPVEDASTKAVAAALFLPSGPGPHPAVIILSGCAGVDVDASVARRLNAEYLPRGIATLVLDSFTPRGLTEVCSDPKLIVDIIPTRVRDTYAAIDWLRGRPDIDAGRIFLQGYSHGAMTAIAAVDAPRPQAQREKIAGVVAYYPYCIASTKFTVPTIVLIGEKDDWTPAKLCGDIADKTNVQVVTYPNAEHAFASPGVDTTLLGHRLLHDAAATADGQQRALAMIERTGR